MKPRNRSITFSLLTLILIAGCSTPSPSRVRTYTTQLKLEAIPARIVVVPFAAPDHSGDASELVTQAFTLETQRSLHSDVVAASAEDARLRAQTSMWQRGRVDYDVLIEARKTYMADAFLFGVITDYKPYDPPLLSVRLSLISAATGEVVWAGGGLFDARDADVRWLGEKFFKGSGMHDTLYGSDLIFMSPKHYATFVASEILSALEHQVEMKRLKITPLE